MFPKEKPDELYRFGDDVPAPQPASGPTFAVRSAGITFDQAAAGDLILTSEGDRVAYVAGGRWASPASVLFRAAVARGFGTNGQARLIEPGEAGRPQYTLRLDVSRFEARYEHGQTAAPTVTVSLRATLIKTDDPSQAAAQEFDAAVPAGDNRIGAIADAFGQATDQVVTKLVGWVDQTGASEAKPGA